MESLKKLIEEKLEDTEDCYDCKKAYEEFKISGEKGAAGGGVF